MEKTIKVKATKFCPNCGVEIDAKAEICPKCGVRIKREEVKNPGIAAVLSVLYVGLGQIYNGEVGKGIGFIIIGIILIVSMFILIGFILYPIFWIFNVYDAYTTAKKINLNEDLSI